MKPLPMSPAAGIFADRLAHPTTQPEEPKMSALEQSFADLCRKHDLGNLSVTYSAEWGFHAYAHGNAGQVGSSTSVRAGIPTCIGEAIRNLDAKRYPAEPVALADERLCA